MGLRWVGEEGLSLGHFSVVKQTFCLWLNPTRICWRLCRYICSSIGMLLRVLLLKTLRIQTLSTQPNTNGQQNIFSVFYWIFVHSPGQVQVKITWITWMKSREEEGRGLTCAHWGGVSSEGRALYFILIPIKAQCQPVQISLVSPYTALPNPINPEAFEATTNRTAVSHARPQVKHCNELKTHLCPSEIPGASAKWPPCTSVSLVSRRR